MLLLPLTLSWGACVPITALEPQAGVPDFVRHNLVAVPGGYVDTAGGNLVLSRLDLSLDTPLGPQEIRAVYNASSGQWLWNFQMTYDGVEFVDATGYVHRDVSPQGRLLTPNGTVPGTVWVRVDDDTLKTRGGLAHHFDAASPRFRLTATVAEYAEILRESYWAQDSSLSHVLALAQDVRRDIPYDGDVAEFVSLVSKAEHLSYRR